MPPTTRQDPFNSTRFLVEIDGLTASAFSSVSGIEAEIAVIDYRSGGEKSVGAKKLPGEARFSNIVLQRGITNDASLWNWMNDALKGNIVRKNMSIVLLNEAGEEVLRFNFKDAWPVKWAGPTLKSESNEVALETLEIAHEGLTVQS
jgi:phage tail-like protein